MIALVLMWLYVLPLESFAQNSKVPGVGYVYPPVVAAGAETTVQLGGYDFTSDLQWFVHDTRIQLQTDGEPGDYHLPPPPYWSGPRASSPAPPIPREVTGRIFVPDDVPDGPVRWQVANANGGSESAVFIVSRAQEVLEHRSRDFPQALPQIPVSVSGRLSRLTEVDEYTFTAEKDGVVRVSLMARQLGANFNGVLRVLNSRNQVLGDFADTEGVDGSVSVPVVAQNSYRIKLHDVDFRGDRAFVYRLTISDAAMPQSPALPATDTNTMAEGAVAAVTVSAPRRLEIPGTIAELFPAQSTELRFQFDGHSGEFWALSARSRAAGGELDLALMVLDAEGKLIAENDDLPGTTDAGVNFQAAADGSCTVIVKRLSPAARSAGGGFGDGNQYQLELRRQAPGFALSVPQVAAVALGSKFEFPVTVIRTGGFSGEIQLSFAGLPAGVTTPADLRVPAGVSELKVPLDCAADAAVTASMLQVSGNAVIAGETVYRTATAVAKGNLCPRTDEEQRTPVALLTITMPAPFSIQVVDRERQHDVHRGTTFPAELEIVRNEGFTGPVRLEMSAQQDRIRMGVRGGIMTVPPGELKALYPTFMPEWLSTDLTRRIVVHGVAEIPDPKGRLRQVSRAGDARITMIMEGALLKLTPIPQELTIRPGETFRIPFRIARSAKLSLPVNVELAVPEEAANLLSSTSLTLSPVETQGELSVSSTASAALSGPWELTLKATALQENRWPVVSQCTVPVEFTDPVSGEPADQSVPVSGTD